MTLDPCNAKAETIGQPTWTEERVEELLRLVRLGHSAGETASLMALTRNTVMGKAYRLGLIFGGDLPLSIKKSPKRRYCGPFRSSRSSIVDPTKGPLMSLISKSGVSMKGSGSSAKTFQPVGSGARPTPSKHKIMTTAPNSTKLDSRVVKGALK